MTRAASIRSRAGWTRLSAPGAKLDARWQHDATGWLVRHCGHPTAHWPYYAVDPEYPTALVVTHNGLGMRTLVDALDLVEAIIAGLCDVRVEHGRCNQTVRCASVREGSAA